MKNILVVKSKKIIPLAYLVTQICIAVSVDELELNLALHLGMMALATVGYLFVCLKDPGFMKTKAQKVNQLKQSEAKASPNKMNDLIESPHSEELNEAKAKETLYQRNLQLGLQSKIDCQEHTQTGEKKSNLSNTIKQHCLQFNQDCIVEGQLGNALVIAQAQGFKPLPQQLKHIKRWCRQCNHQQPLRVRHCLDCNRCVRSFDHHCPWINNCIGQKNKLFLIVFLILQLAQLLALSLELGLVMMTTFHKQSLFLQVVLICLSLVVLGVLSFQLFIVSLNLSTWQYLRWNRIEYLMPFQQKKLLSLFYQGFINNIRTFFKANLSTQPVDWQKHINVHASDCLITAKSSTERRLSIQVS